MISETQCINYVSVCNIVMRSDARVLFISNSHYSIYTVYTRTELLYKIAEVAKIGQFVTHAQVGLA